MVDAVVYVVAPSVLIAVVLIAALLDRWSVPVILIALGAGIVVGSDVLGLWVFDDYELTNELANTALVLILFHGGFSTRRKDFRAVALPAGGLATWGVVLTAAVTYAVLRFGLGVPMEAAMLVSVVISSTDAAATFSILRRQSLPTKLSSTVQIESAANDPMAILLTQMSVEMLTSGDALWHEVTLLFVWKFVGGIALGWLLAHGALWIFNRAGPRERGHYYVLTLGMVLLIYGLAETAQASGMLAVFIAGFVMGNRPFVHKQGVMNFSAALSTVADIGMFVLMGVLVSPRQWGNLWVEGLLLFVVLTFIARPAAVWLGTLGMGLDRKYRIFIAWAGLRGAVPIVLATYPMAANMAIGQQVFNLVFFAVILSVLIQGSTLGPVARWLRLSTPERPQSLYKLELIAMTASDLDLVVVDLPGSKGDPGPRIRDLRLPPGAVITLITRGPDVVIPKGNTRLEGWDQVTVLAHAADEGQVRGALLDPFEQPAED